MTRSLSSILAIIVAVVVPAIASAGATEKEKFDKAVAKFAPSFGEAFGLTRPLKVKTLCLCTDAPRTPGFLFRGGDGSVLCALPIFLDDGSFADAAPNCDHFEILSK